MSLMVWEYGSLGGSLALFVFLVFYESVGLGVWESGSLEVWVWGNIFGLFGFAQGNLWICLVFFGFLCFFLQQKKPKKTKQIQRFPGGNQKKRRSPPDFQTPILPDHQTRRKSKNINKTKDRPDSQTPYSQTPRL